MRVALLQMTSSDAPEENRRMITPMLEEAARQGAAMVFTPEVTNCVSMDRAHQARVLATQSEDATLAHLQAEAARLGLWINAGSLALKSDPPEPRFANRGVMIDPSGAITATYDKMHMFDVSVSPTETYRESSGYAPGSRAVLARTPLAAIGMTVCYDLRFPALYRALAQAGAEILTVPAAFSTATGPVHWQPLLQARAIETGCFVVAAAQTGTHPSQTGKPRRTYGHAMIVSPWGDVLLDAGTRPGVFIADLDLDQVADARRRVPSLTHDRAFDGPEP
ncbi:carbon-nitrogen hydrolase family protein [Cognatishimia sp. F0-27]|uniref:carbon-nitrogen hydrolase family protein n=1 Tax=Cognatishimia sp. F0-27 TaxID=2816855 RepID=UPI001D0C33F0|nr:carbon-nitrogen hydrolase family protein [Cognatishimia sp. F0-27]MCC1493103.1 carbon-nitrogen hydrolase family protein [Cognatishimia sp. F0-27]